MKSFILMSILLSACGQEAQMADSNTKNTFAYASRNSNIVELFNLDNNTITVGSLDVYLDGGSVEGEFSGPLISCGNLEQHCLSSGLAISIPIGPSVPSRWRGGGLECSKISERQIEGDAFIEARCDYQGRPQTAFSFSTVRGLLSYRRLCASCEDADFVLIGDRGLFAKS